MIIYIDLEEQYRKIYRYCYFKLQHQQLAEDITQETFLKFYESNQYVEAGKKVRYLYKIAHNLCVDLYRKEKIDTKPLTDELFVEDTEEEILTSIAVKRALMQLEQVEQEILLLRYVNEVPVSDICNILHISRFSLYRKTKKAVEHFKNILGEGFI